MSDCLANARFQKGVSMIETLLVFPVIFLMGLGIVHLGLVYQAKSNLEYAALMAARVGSVSSIDITRMRNEVVARMAPSQIGSAPIHAGDVSIEIINPTVAMFAACGQTPLDTSLCLGANCEIPNFGLQYRSTAPICNGASIQDANLLRIKVTVRYDTKVPFMNVRMFSNDTGNAGGATGPASGSGIDISAISTVRMQTPARMTADNQGFIR